MRRQVREAVARLYMNPVLRHLPSLPARFRRPYASPRRPWPAWDREVPPALRSGAGVPRVPADEDAAFAAAPLEDWSQVNAEAMAWLRGSMWRAMMPVGPRMWRARTAARTSNDTAPAPEPTALSPTALTAAVRAFAAEIGISAVGVAAFDERYMFAQWRGSECGDRVLVCVLEQNDATTQRIPSNAAEQTAISTYAELVELCCRLAALLHAHGHRAQVHDPLGRGITIHYAVEAGLGQLGLNGQLLTPAAGSRCRLILINTDAPLTLDAPRDFGIPELCDQCRVCVRRCPTGAIPQVRANHRGVIKTKINTKRCFPMVTAAHGCAICMKVCPVQRYGLDAVLDEYERSGGVLGKDTDELEGYDWPLDEQHYGPGEKPRIDERVLVPQELLVAGLRARRPPAPTADPAVDPGERRTWA